MLDAGRVGERRWRNNLSQVVADVVAHCLQGAPQSVHSHIPRAVLAWSCLQKISKPAIQLANLFTHGQLLLGI